MVMAATFRVELSGHGRQHDALRVGHLLKPPRLHASSSLSFFVLFVCALFYLLLLRPEELTVASGVAHCSSLGSLAHMVKVNLTCSF